jgi:hypothetical protein
LSLWLSLVAATAPVPKDRIPLYHPIEVGAKKVCIDEAKTEFTEVVTDVEEKDGVLLVKVAGLNGKAEWKATLAVSRQGVVHIHDDEETTWAEPVLKTPFKAGNSWTVESKRFGGYKATYTVGKSEWIEVPAGKYLAVPVTREYVCDDNQAQGSEITWYVPGIGEIKQIAKTKDGRVQSKTVLKSFTPGKP